MLTLSVALRCAVVAAVAAADLNVSLPVNLTAAFARPGVDFGGLRRLLIDGAFRAFDLVANATVDCVPEGQPCAPDTGSCCDGLRCEPGTRTCLGPADSDDEAADRLDALELADSDGRIASHPWAYSWEFQSRSEMEKEEMAAAEEADWKKNWTPKKNVDSKWAKLKDKIEQRARNAWKSMKMWKKLNELKGKIVERYKQKIAKKDDVKNPDVSENLEVKEPHEEERVVTERYRKKLKFDSNDESHGFFENGLGHKEEEEEEGSNVEGSEPKPESEESVIKFSDELPKRRKKIHFRIDDIIKDGVDMIANKIKAKTKSKHGRQHEFSAGTSLEKQLYEPGEIDDTEDRLMKEINELKKLRRDRGERGNARRKPDDDLDVEELIKRQVATILDEERKLERLRKIEELKRMEQGIGNNRVNK